MTEMMTKEAVLRWEKDCRDTYLNDFSADTIVEFTKPLYARVDAYTTGKTTGERSVIELKKREKRLCTATTAEDYGKVKELKDVTLLDKEEALWTKDRLSKN